MVGWPPSWHGANLVSCVRCSVHVLLLPERSLLHPCRQDATSFSVAFVLFRAKPDVAATCCCDTIFTTVLVRHTDALMSCCCCWPRKQLKLRLETSTLIKQKKDAWSEVLHLLNEWRSLFSSASSARDKDKEQRLSALASGLQYENFQNGCQ